MLGYINSLGEMSYRKSVDVNPTEGTSRLAGWRPPRQCTPEAKIGFRYTFLSRCSRDNPGSPSFSQVRATQRFIRFPTGVKKRGIF